MDCRMKICDMQFVIGMSEEEFYQFVSAVDKAYEKFAQYPDELVNIGPILALKDAMIVTRH